MQRQTQRPLTTRQVDTLRAIADHVLRRATAPTVLEIGAAIGLRSTSTVHSHVETLVKRGLLSRRPKCPRSLGITEAGWQQLGQEVRA